MRRGRSGPSPTAPASPANSSPSRDAPKPGAVPWLLLKVKAHVGAYGKLTDAAYVRRIDTSGGGEPEDGCDDPHLGDIARVRYSATYEFYGQ